MSKLTPFSFLNEINYGKTDIMVDDVAEKQYVPFMVNRTLSYFQDTVLLANEMNKYHNLDNKPQFHFLINMVRRRKRFTKWHKPLVESDLDVVKEFYGYSTEKAVQALSLLTPDQIITLRKKVNKGGTK